ncbi:MAG TPA: hypothetical protein DIT49_03560, partial [Clostridiales bacterium]|nr:hypothetical protein [Clostridiales bacterium]
SEGRVYIAFPRAEAAQALRCSTKTATRVFQELEDAKLIERKKEDGPGSRTIVYLFDFLGNSSAEDAPAEDAPAEGASAEGAPAEDVQAGAQGAGGETAPQEAEGGQNFPTP